jgi:hypothetical protein
MKSRISILGLLLLGGCVTADLSVKKDFKRSDVKRIGVIDFTTPRTARADTYGQLAADTFSAELLRVGFSVIERSQIKKIVDELHLGQSGVVDAASAKEVGRVAGVDAMVMGTITPALVEGRITMPQASPRRARRTNGGPVIIEEPHLDMTNVTVSGKMISVETGEILWVGSASGTDVRNAVRQITKRIGKEVPL